MSCTVPKPTIWAFGHINNSDQPEHPHRLIRVIDSAQWIVKDLNFLYAESMIFEDFDQTEHAQADPSLLWAQMPYCWLSYSAAYIIVIIYIICIVIVIISFLAGPWVV